MKRKLTSIAGAVALLAVTAAGYGHPPRQVRVTAAVDAAIAPPAPVLGVDVESDVNYSVSTAKAYGSRLAAYIHGTLDATSLGIVWVFCDPSFTSTSSANASGRCPRLR